MEQLNDINNPMVGTSHPMNLAARCWGPTDWSQFVRWLKVVLMTMGKADGR